MLRRQFLAATHLVLLIHFITNVFAQEPQLRLQTTSPGRNTGLLTNRLSAKDLERWEKIEQIVFAEDSDRLPVHLTLRWLWEWIDTSGHSVYIEMIRTNRTLTCTAGSFRLESFDPSGQRHVGVIKLNLPNIDVAYVGPTSKRANGFIPFKDLEKEERYAEVLGHELAHAVHILASHERTQKVWEYVERTNNMLLTQHIRRNSFPIAPDLKRRLSKRDALLKELESQAEKSEEAVWRELIASKSKKERENTKQTK
jgi:hypothetical protein